jgi:hypothetical protein
MAFPLVAALMKGFKLGATGLGLMGGAPVGAARAGAGALNLLKQAYTPNAMGLMNLGMDAIPLAMDIANNDVGLKSFSSFGGTMLGTKFGGRELNKLGEKQIKSDVLDRAQRYSQTQAKYNARPSVISGGSKPMGDIKSYDMEPFEMRQTKKYQDDPQYSRQGYNMPIGFAADTGLYTLTSGMNKPKPSEFEQQMMEMQNPSPVSRYLQMTGVL